MIDLWFTEKHSEGAKFSIHVKKHLYSAKSPFQQIDFFESEEFGKFFTLDGIMMANEKDEFIYHEMITHVPLASNPLIKKVLTSPYMNVIIIKRYAAVLESADRHV